MKSKRKNRTFDWFCAFEKFRQNLSTNQVIFRINELCVFNSNLFTSVYFAVNLFYSAFWELINKLGCTYPFTAISVIMSIKFR